MRFLLKVSIPVEGGNRLIKEGRLASTIESIFGDLKPEAAYFSEEQGKRTAYLVVDIPEASHIPRVAEPFFIAFNADVEFHPIMSAEDLMRAGPAIERAAKQYG